MGYSTEDGRTGRRCVSQVETQSDLEREQSRRKIVVYSSVEVLETTGAVGCDRGSSGMASRQRKLKVLVTVMAMKTF